MGENGKPNAGARRVNHPKEDASFLSLLFMFWLNKILRLGNKRPLQDDDLFPILIEHKTETLTTELENSWTQELRNAEKLGRRPRLWKVMFTTFTYNELCVMITFKVLEFLGNSTLAIMLWFYLKELNEGSHMDQLSAIPFVTGISLAGLLKVFSDHHYTYKALLKRMQLRVAVTGMIYNKILVSSRSSLGNVTGHIINLVSNDAQRIESGVMLLGMTLLTPIEIIVSIVLLSVLIGWQSLSGAFLLLFGIVYNVVLSNKFANLRAKAAGVTDKRLSAMNEIISGIRAVKMYAWEWNYRDMVKALRRTEMNIIWLKSHILSSFSVNFLTSGSLASIISITTLLYSGVHLSAFSIFTLVTLLNMLKFSVTINMAESLRGVLDTKVAIDRMEQFLWEQSGYRNHAYEEGKGIHIQTKCNLNGNQIHQLKKEFTPKYTERLSTILRVESCRTTTPALLTLKKLRSEMECDTSELQPYLNLTDVFVSWNDKMSEDTLQGISLHVTSDQLVVVTGEVGSGKSTLLMAIQGEIPLKAGSVSGQGTIAFVSQIPWGFSGTVRDNIIFGRCFDEEKYKRILKVCDLHDDLNRFPKHDLTMIGQRGVSLSGGQRARVSLARAIYSGADIFLLDDPLSAVDAKVGQLIFDKCICGELSGRIRILATHQVQYLHRADYIVILSNGRVVSKGSYDDLKNTEVLNSILEENKSEDLTTGSSNNTTHSVGPDVLEGDEREGGGHDLEEEDEDRVVGTVTWRLYWEYFNTGLPAGLLVCYALFYLIVEVIVLSPNWWLSRMADMSHKEQRSSVTLGIYGTLVVSTLILTLARAFLFFYTSLRASEKLHDKMVASVIKSPVLFFDTNPVGRIMNRFSKDTGCMDDLLPMLFNLSLLICCHAVGAALLTAVINFWLFIVVIPLFGLFILLGRYYLKSARELKRMEAIRCSPLYAHISDTITGLEIIRTFKMEKDFFDLLVRHQDEHTKAFFLVTSTNRWLGLLLDLLCNFLITAVAVGSLILIQDPALAGLTLTFSIELLSGTEYGVRAATEVESLMTAVERVMSYTKLPSEPGYSRQTQPPKHWPDKGALSIRGMDFEYLDGGPRIFSNLTFEVQPKEKIGIAGRTGAGKSSLVAALFRMPNPQGEILIDGVDLGTINIQAARRAIGVITQDPVLFAGSLRKNLDPFRCFTDQDIWTALEEVQLKQSVQDLPDQLEYAVGESGSGFSVGERQLLCLARALLQRCKVLVMDEATANVDFKTDRLIQQVIRDKFANCTVLTIAHRINTIMDYDKVLVLDRGRVVEYDKPQVLARKENGVFARLAQSKFRNSPE